MNTQKQLQLVTFNQAKRLKEAGFTWETTDFYSHEDMNENSDFKLETRIGFENFNHFSDTCSAPTVALALKWFRDVKDQLSEVMYTDNGRFYYRVKLLKWSEASQLSFDTCEAADRHYEERLSRNGFLGGFEKGATAMYSALKDQIEWVSVEERLPEKGDVVLIKCKNYNGLICNAWFDGRRCHIDFINGKRYSPDISHWRRIEL